MPQDDPFFSAYTPPATFQACTGEVDELWVTIARNGVRQYCLRCNRCGRRHGSLNLNKVDAAAHAARMGYGNLDKVPVWADHRGGEQCSVDGCDSYDVECHHWAPSAIFSKSVEVPAIKPWVNPLTGETVAHTLTYESDLWPTSYLCVDHHREWHRRVTPALNHIRTA